MSKLMIRRVFSSLAGSVILIALLAGNTFFTPRAAMQSAALVPDLGIGASLHGARPFPANNAWNLDVSRFPVHSNSANLIASIGANTGLHPDFGTFWQGAPIGIPYVVVGGTQAMVPINFTDYGDQSDPGPYPVPANAPIEGGSASTGDRHVLTIDRDNWKLYELYYSFPQNGGASWDASSGAVWNFNSNKLRPATWTSADAAGLPIFPGLVRRDEVVELQAIRHALRFTVQTSRRAYVYPATHQAGSTTSTNAPPMGLRVRLKSDFNIENPAFSPNVRVILTALKKYGMIVADNGSNWYISGTHDPLWNDDEYSALSQVKGSNFEVVQTPNHLLMPQSDFDGDGRTDLSVFRPSTGTWYASGSTDGVFRAQAFGISTDKPAPGDYDGDGLSDNAVFRDGVWHISNSSNGSYRAEQFGVAGDVPVAADFDADGRTDLAVFRPSNGTWYVRNSADNSFRANQFGLSTDKPAVADYDGDGKADIAVFRPSTGQWWIWQSSNGAYRSPQFGLSGDIPVVADYDADGLADVAVFRPSTGVWYIMQSTDGLRIAQWGLSTDRPTPGDYDGDNRADLAVFRPATGVWYIMQSWNNTFRANQFGLNGDSPAPAAYLP
ncbi:MAG: VCBS repeat-containing protein [Acidobacteria bacterium]|nr:VCBS repeat-containing protein [Acidobacteriota bacterium]